MEQHLSEEQRATNEFVSFLARGNRVLDFSCDVRPGTGVGSLQARITFRCNEELSKAWVCWIATELPFAESSFDLVKACETAAQSALTCGLIEEVCRVLMPDGIFVVRIPDENAGVIEPVLRSNFPSVQVVYQCTQHGLLFWNGQRDENRIHGGQLADLTRNTQARFAVCAREGKALAPFIYLLGEDVRSPEQMEVHEKQIADLKHRLEIRNLSLERLQAQFTTAAEAASRLLEERRDLQHSRWTRLGRMLGFVPKGGDDLR